MIESVKIANKPMESLVNLCFNSLMSLTDFLSDCVFIQFDSTFYFIEICGRDWCKYRICRACFFHQLIRFSDLLLTYAKSPHGLQYTHILVSRQYSVILWAVNFLLKGIHVRLRSHLRISFIFIISAFCVHIVDHPYREQIKVTNRNAKLYAAKQK